MPVTGSGTPGNAIGTATDSLDRPTSPNAWTTTLTELSGSPSIRHDVVVMFEHTGTSSASTVYSFRVLPLNDTGSQLTVASPTSQPVARMFAGTLGAGNSVSVTGAELVLSPASPIAVTTTSATMSSAVMSQLVPEMFVHAGLVVPAAVTVTVYFWLALPFQSGAVQATVPVPASLAVRWMSVGASGAVTTVPLAALESVDRPSSPRARITNEWTPGVPL
jgi:hypothetical protein